MEAPHLAQPDPLIETGDLAMFSDQEDLFNAGETKTFNMSRLNQTITDSAHRALQVCNAQAQLMLAKYQTESADDMKVARLKAEHIAYDLGDSEYDPNQERDNPFDETLLAQAWQEGYDAARSAKRFRPMLQIEQKYWEEGVNTEDARSQYELCALQLFRIASQVDDPHSSERAKRLAMEMCRYHEGETPSNNRQAEIDRFMAKQAERIARAIDF
ncbi:MAG: hypothetical protein CMK83_09470 [Pseudomonadales bacterium]|uniref:hypothetical protein n=1 Tax=unclassified Ketobacter TaxID=2639109 RepID=UPI000C60B693|nr:MULTISPECIES: hypothetical protein [unclassified Ketobacter]MAQ24439.1 hypothetical protein [Pseudomonadales bacterium]MEC8812892.1 hypothetical protein [Pseudomonadota bacterium]TNC86561.1 MAG: hypothetical protein CSH49_16230 [Alcanivorax sp.]HAG92559.1 hypothetical protein [Gammaproteobacteria bacterium]MBI25343.1 hypothetical protein [Pseudomonadales bacterium]